MAAAKSYRRQQIFSNKVCQIVAIESPLSSAFLPLSSHLSSFAKVPLINGDFYVSDNDKNLFGGLLEALFLIQHQHQQQQQQQQQQQYFKDIDKNSQRPVRMTASQIVNAWNVEYSHMQLLSYDFLCDLCNEHSETFSIHTRKGQSWGVDTLVALREPLSSTLGLPDTTMSLACQAFRLLQQAGSPLSSQSF
ncbi:hypothetical protein RFI_10249, partial [Reticulomyxa filosa]